MASSRPEATSSSSPADLARGPDGRWRIIDTHTETPAGIGYAIANRMVHTNVAGDIFGACQAMRLAPFFQQLQGALAGRANRADPTIALLTPGPRHNDFFSHAYLARYLGLLLVEGGDLRVTGERVSLKTLHGLMPIDLIVRCVAGARGRPAGARRLGLRRSRRPAAGHPQAARPRRQRAGNRARREPRLERLPAEARQRGARRGPAGAGRAQVVAGRCGEPPARAGQPRAHGHPSGARGHGPAGRRHTGHRPRAPGSRRARPAAAGDRDQGGLAGRRGEGRLRHDAVADDRRAWCRSPTRCACSWRRPPTASRRCPAASP